MLKEVKPLLILFAISLICQNFGPLSYNLGHVLSFSFILLYLCVTVLKTKKDIFFLPIFLIIALMITRCGDSLIQLLLLPAFLLLLITYSEFRKYQKKDHIVLFFVSAFFAIVFFLYEYCAEGWYAAQYCSVFFSSVCSFIYSRSLHIGPTFFGFFIFVSFFIYHFVLFILSKNRNIIKFVFAVVLLNLFLSGLTCCLSLLQNITTACF